MKSYMLIFRLDSRKNAKPSDEQVKERKDWFGALVSSGRLADKGNTLSPVSAKTIVSGDSVEDGPFLQDNRLVSGYVVIKAEDMEDAVGMARTNPIFEVGGTIEVREVVTFLTGE